MLKKVKKLCDIYLEAGLQGYDLVIYKDGKCIYRKFDGVSDVENKIPMNGKERYNIYSCSKPITCTAALQLWEKGLFSLEDKLSDYMPEFAEMMVKTEDGIKKAQKPILIKQLFEMTAGFSYDVSLPSLMKCHEETNGKCPTRETMRYLAKEPLSFEPGDRWEYSLCHDVLAAFVEVVSGEKFELYVKKNIFDKLGMDNSTFLLPDDELDTLAEQYCFQNGKHKNVGKNIVFYKFGSEYVSGGAGGISTVDDYIKFLEGLRTGVLLKPETLKLMTTHRLTEDQERTYFTGETHGYGLGVRCDVGVEGYSDFGWSGAAGAYLGIDLKKGISFYFATHLLSSPVQSVAELLRVAIAEITGDADLDKVSQKIKKLYNYDLTH